jgi:hypothetical protein
MAHDLLDKKDVALKVMVSRDGAEREYAMQNEIMRTVKDTSGLVVYQSTFKIYGYKGVVYRVFVLPLHGPSLATCLRQRPIVARMSAAWDLLKALNSLHEAGIVHRGELNYFTILLIEFLVCGMDIC